MYHCQGAGVEVQGRIEIAECCWLRPRCTGTKSSSCHSPLLYRRLCNQRSSGLLAFGAQPAAPYSAVSLHDVTAGSTSGLALRPPNTPCPACDHQLHAIWHADSIAECTCGCVQAEQACMGGGARPGHRGCQGSFLCPVRACMSDRPQPSLQSAGGSIQRLCSRVSVPDISL